MSEELRVVSETVLGPQKLPRVERIHRAVGGDGLVEEMILRFIVSRNGARNLLYLPANVAVKVVKRPTDFIRAAKSFCELELF